MDLHHNIQATPAIEPQAATSASTAINSAQIDLQALGSPSAVEVLCQIGALYAGASWAFTITEGNLANGSDQAAPASSSILGNLPTINTPNTLASFGYIGLSRYIIITATPTGGGATSYPAATIIAGYTRKQPTQTP